MRKLKLGIVTVVAASALAGCSNIAELNPQPVATASASSQSTPVTTATPAATPTPAPTQRAETPQVSAVAAILELKGQGFVTKRSGEEAWSQAAQDVVIGFGQKLKTGTGNTSVVELLVGARFAMEAETEVEFGPGDDGAGGGLTLHSGRVNVITAPEMSGQMTVATPVGVVRVKGREVEVEFRNKQMVAEARKGSIEVELSNGEVLEIAEGQGLEFNGSRLSQY